MKVDEDKWKWLMKRCGCIWKWRVVVGGTWSWKQDGDGSVAGNWKWTRIFQGAKGEILKKLTNGCVSVNGMEHVYNLLAGLLASTLPDHQPMHWPIRYRSIDRQSMVSGLLQVCHANVFLSFTIWAILSEIVLLIMNYDPCISWCLADRLPFLSHDPMAFLAVEELLWCEAKFESFCVCCCCNIQMKMAQLRSMKWVL